MILHVTVLKMKGLNNVINDGWIYLTALVFFKKRKKRKNQRQDEDREEGSWYCSSSGLPS